MAKHRHAEMIKVKADNMDLLVFLNSGKEWVKSSLQTIVANQDLDFFLCLPKHKEACLHWLNGGEIEFSSEFSDGWTEYDPIKAWGAGSIFMQDDYEIRIKPQKEKLWIAARKVGYERLGGNRKVRVCSHAFVSKSDAEEYLNLNDSVLIEIKV